jgi:hypothetical protein
MCVGSLIWLFMKIPITWSKIGRSTLAFMRSVSTSSIATKLRARARNLRGVSGMNFHEDPCNMKQDREDYFGLHAKCPYFSIATKPEHVNGMCARSQVWLFMKIPVTWIKIGRGRTSAVMWSAHISFPITRKFWAWIKSMRDVTDMNFGENNSDRITINGEYVRALFFVERDLTSWPIDRKLRAVRFVRDILYLLLLYRWRDARFALSTMVVHIMLCLISCPRWYIYCLFCWFLKKIVQFRILLGLCAFENGGVWGRRRNVVWQEVALPISYYWLWKLPAGYML